EQLLLLGRECLVRFGRRHDFLRVGREDMLDELAQSWLAGNNGLLLEGDFANIQPQLCFALVLVRPVACVTVLGQNRANVAAEPACFGWIALVLACSSSPLTPSPSYFTYTHRFDGWTPPLEHSGPKHQAPTPNLQGSSKSHAPIGRRSRGLGTAWGSHKRGRS